MNDTDKFFKTKITFYKDILLWGDELLPLAREIALEINKDLENKLATTKHASCSLAVGYVDPVLDWPPSPIFDKQKAS